MTERQQSSTPILEQVEQVSDGWVKKYLLQYRLPDGRPHTYESVSRKPLQEYLDLMQNLAERPAHEQASDAVCIVPITQDDRLVLNKEFRYPLNNWCIQFPAGLIDPGETVEQAVERELMEETGYPLFHDSEGKHHMRIFPQPGYSSAGLSEESVRMVFAKVEDEPRLGQHTEACEYIDVFTIPRQRISSFLQQNTLPLGTRTQLVLESLSRDLTDL